MSQPGARIRAVLPAMMAPLLALPGCTATRPGLPLALGCTARSAGAALTRWWPGLGDVQLSALIERALEPGPAPTSAQDRLIAAIARRYIALRAQQSALVLLAAREEVDSQLLTMARQPIAASAAPRQPVAAAEAQLADTRAAQTRSRAQIAALRVELAVLTGTAPATLDKMPDGPIPLPPAPPQGGASYAAAQRAAAHAQSEALSAIAAAQTMRAHTVPARETLAAERRVLAALQAEQQARAAMTQAYVRERDAAAR